MLILYRPATEDDVEPMMRIGHEGVRPHVEKVRGWNQEAEEARFREHFDIEKVSVICLDGEDIGYLKTESYVDHFYIDGIYLKSGRRNGGVGTEVIKGIIKEAVADNKSVRLRVFRTNPARNLYARLGFAVVRETDSHIYMEWMGQTLT
ncbi:MAG: GNAT family N-acetyltransferase [Verrucomicrobiales bacterium]